MNDDKNEPPEWIAKAEGDCAMTISAIRRTSPITFAACFHAQQCAEKYMKAMLVALKQRFPKAHDLVALNKQCEESGILITVSEDGLQRLSYHAVETRYPGQVPSIEDAREALETAKAVRRFARKFLNVK